MRALWSVFVVAVALALGCAKASAGDTEVMVAAATSLRGVMPELEKVYAEKHPGTHVAATFGASGDLRKQVEGGAPIDAVMFADAKTADALIASGRADAATRKVLATNKLVLVGPPGAKGTLTFATLDTAPATEKIAIGEPNAVPAGRYAKEALQKLGKWDAIQARVVYGGDVAAVLAYAKRGEVVAAIVYATEVRGVDGIAVLDEAKGDWVPRVEVVAAVVNDGKAAASAAQFIDFVAGADGQKILASYGFGPP